MAEGLIADGSHVTNDKLIGRDPSKLHIAAIHDARIRERARNLPPLSFRSVNRFGTPGFEPGLQRHHILPLQLLTKASFARMFDAIGFRCRRFDDFRSNGLLRPSIARTAILMGLPLHRGPHRACNDLVIERVGQIEARWSSKQTEYGDQAGIEAFYRLELLQNALRRRLLDPRGRKFALNRSDPAHQQPNFFDLDAMIDKLWTESSTCHQESDAGLPASVIMPNSISPVGRPKRSVKNFANLAASLLTPDQQLQFPGFTTEFPLQPKPITLLYSSAR